MNGRDVPDFLTGLQDARALITSGCRSLYFCFSPLRAQDSEPPELCQRPAVAPARRLKMFTPEEVHNYGRDEIKWSLRSIRLPL
jgi:hypothetical protein